MKPLSEQDLREKISSIIFADDFPILDRDDKEALDMLVGLILQDRKAYAEYVIGGNIPFLQLNDGSSRKKQDVYASGQKHMMNRLLADQRQRNQGEKTDE